ncbi:MAG: hypothetical protein JO165_06370 [Candidatus Eremiobacteraeota bacterium]|nr:hypothetical protein [Candidatus Eremiobacteraeota bacterium]
MKYTLSIIACLCLASVTSACSGSSRPSALPPVAQGNGSTATSAPSVTFAKHDTNDTLTGGLTIGDDGSLYATTPDGIDIFSPYTPFQSAIRHLLTWPVVPGLKPLGHTQRGTGDTVWTLATQGGSTSSPSTLGLTTATPVLVVYEIKNASFTVVPGTAGDTYAGLTAGADHPTFVSANTPASNGAKGYVFGVSCLQTKVFFNPPLGPIAFHHADSRLYVATDPTLGPNTPSEILSLDSNTGQKFAPIVLPAGSRVTDITEGSDGNIWFTDAGLNEIGMLQNGVVSYFTIPTPNALPERITGENAGALWFTENAANAIGRIRLDGSIIEYPVPQPSANVIGIAACGQCQNKVYFTETHAIGRVTF